MNHFCPAESVAVNESPVGKDVPLPVLAAAFALAGISLGQFYNGRPFRGICWGTAGIVIFLLVWNNPLIAPAGFFFLAACVIDAYSTAQEIGKSIVPSRGIHPLFWIEAMLALSFATAGSITCILQILSVGGTAW
ncbi:MAG: hypothetical protein M0Q92_02125 [Methanoregula sp.]|jgi:TM2 domain-containing membrane protein YozV|nr:hypothetical protein [Methanoregula sp.]